MKVGNLCYSYIGYMKVCVFLEVEYFIVRKNIGDYIGYIFFLVVRSLRFEIRVLVT